ncbi:MAG: flavin-containing monooxygenase [Hyphomicrobiales bacterium]|nr:flavin-containing monooxygenase [Hyphomicrobiales bacterium]
MSTTQIPHYDVVVVGGGQAGLSASHYLSKRGLSHVVFEKKSAMHKWRDERWDNFCLVTPNWQCRLPDHPYDGADPHGFMVKEEILAYLDRFAAKVKAPIQENTGVTAIEREGAGFRVETQQGVVTANAVIVATSLYGAPSLPPAAAHVPSDIMQMHTADYRSAAQLPDGAVLVVGSGQSGAQIAEDLHLAGRQVHLATGNAPRCARFYRGRDVVDWLWDIGQYAITIAHDGMGKKRHDTNHYLTGRDGGRDIDLRAFALQGMKLYGRLTGCSKGQLAFEPNLARNLDEADKVYNGINALIDRHIADNSIEAPAGAPYVPLWTPDSEPTSLDLRAENVSAIVWATGFTPDFSFVRLPIFDGTGYPVQRRGVTGIPGLYMLGLPWLWTWGSGRFLGVGEDADYVVNDAAAHVARVAHSSAPLARAG